MRNPTPSRRRFLQLGSAILLGSIAGCVNFDMSSNQPPKIPVYAYNADVRERDLRLVVSSLGESGKEKLPIENHRSINSHTTKQLLTVDVERFLLDAYIDDSGTGTAMMEVTPDKTSYSQAGYLIVIDSEKVDGSQIQINPLSPRNR